MDLLQTCRLFGLNLILALVFLAKGQWPLVCSEVSEMALLQEDLLTSIWLVDGTSGVFMKSASFLSFPSACTFEACGVASEVESNGRSSERFIYKISSKVTCRIFMYRQAHLVTHLQGW